MGNIYKSLEKGNTKYHVINPDMVMNSTAVIVEKNNKALLVNTQFSNLDARNIISVLKEKNLELVQIYISYSDPDFYFGLTDIKKEFPNVIVSSTKSTLERIKKSAEAKISVWKDVLQENTPDSIVYPDVMIEDKVEFEGKVFEIKGKDKKRAGLYSAEDNLLFASIDITANDHLFIADTKKVEQITSWIADLDYYIAENIETIIPSHFEAPVEFNAETLKANKKYLEDFISINEKTASAEELIAEIKKLYPNLGGDINLDLSAKAIKGEMEWEAWD